MSKQIRVPNKVYYQLEKLIQPRETFGDVVSRLLDKETPHAQGVKRPRAERPEAEAK